MNQERWTGSWYELRAGSGCGMCANQGLEDSGWGVRFLKGRWADVFLWRSGRVRGYAVAIWQHQHVADHIVPRYADDPLPGRPLPFDFLDNGRQPEERLQADVLALRGLLQPGR